MREVDDAQKSMQPLLLCTSTRFIDKANCEYEKEGSF